MNTEPTAPLPASPPLPAPTGCAAGTESEICSSCEGYGSILYNPNLNPNAFLASASAKCTHCGGTGRIVLRQPQHNKEVSDGGPLTPESKPNANPPFAGPTSL